LAFGSMSRCGVAIACGTVQRLGATTVVFWQEGTVACALISDAAAEAVFELAVGKAMRAA